MRIWPGSKATICVPRTRESNPGANPAAVAWALEHPFVFDRRSPATVARTEAGCAGRYEGCNPTLPDNGGRDGRVGDRNESLLRWPTGVPTRLPGSHAGFVLRPLSVGRRASGTEHASWTVLRLIRHERPTSLTATPAP